MRLSNVGSLPRRALQVIATIGGLIGIATGISLGRWVVIAGFASVIIAPLALAAWDHLIARIKSLEDDLIFDPGVDEERRRQRALQLASRVTSPPEVVSVDHYHGRAILVGVFPKDAYVEIGARFRVEIAHEPRLKGVVEIAYIDRSTQDPGKVVVRLACVHKPEDAMTWWGELNRRSATDSAPPLGIQLSPYYVGVAPISGRQESQLVKSEESAVDAELDESES